jgi:polyferredoxin
MSSVAQNGALDVRLIATVRTDGGQLQPSRSLSENLERRLETVLHIPPLRDRSRDILPLARHFLEEVGDGADVHLSEAAEHALLGLGYGHRNVAELREVIELAVRCADGPEVRAEHIFSGFGEVEEPVGFDVGRLGLISRLARPGWMGALRAMVMAGFAAVIVLCIAAGTGVYGRTANSLIWGLWEPVVFALFLFLGPVWCTVCPLSSAGRLMQRVFSLRRPPPGWLKRYGVWLAIVGFFLILWVERVFHMTTRPLGSGVLLAALVAASVVCCAIYQREVWCRHLCPLGRLAATLAPPAPLHLSARRSVCASTCTTHDCFKGSGGVPGCTVYHHPLLINESHNCKLCLDCLRTCPHGSARLYLQPPLQSVWRLTGAGSGLAPFAICVALWTPVVLASQRSGWVAKPLGLTIAAVLALVLGAALSMGLPALLLGRGEGAAAATAQVACAVMILGWGPLMAYQLGNIPPLTVLHLVAETGSSWLLDLVGPEMSVLLLSRIGVILLAALLAGLVLHRLQLRWRRQGPAVAPMRWALLYALCGAYTCGALLIAVG